MSGPEAAGDRSDRLVVLARGRSARMGRSKGLVCLPDDARPLLVRVLDLYRTFGMAGLVVALDAAAADYGNLVRRDRDVEIWPAAGGAGTARTVAIAWAAVGTSHSHLWAHPVDLPLVRPGTLELLRRSSAAQPARVVRPVYRGRPGHPVVLPCTVLAALDATLREAGGLFAVPGDMKDLLRAEPLTACGADLETVAVDDPGVVQDFDDPGTLETRADVF